MKRKSCDKLYCCFVEFPEYKPSPEMGPPKFGPVKSVIMLVFRYLLDFQSPTIDNQELFV